LPEEIKETILCEKIGWTHEEYLKQPAWLIDTFLLKWSLDNEHQNNQNKKYGNK
jgi:hypothetical protein